MEVWKDIEGYEGIYQISSLGRVKSCDRYTPKKNGRMRHEKEKLRALIDVHGYLYCELWINNTHKRYAIHRLVAGAFIPNPENKPEVNHKDGNKKNNVVDNLEWVTYSENNLHAFKLGLMKAYDRSGENNPMYGKHHSDSAKEKIGAVHKGLKHSEEAKRKMSAKHKGRKFTKEHKKNIGISNTIAKSGCRLLIKDGVKRYCKGAELEEKLSNGWQYVSKKHKGKELS